VDVLEYGCGTGAAACFLAAQGFRVDAVDLIPQAITLARRFARVTDADRARVVVAVGARLKDNGYYLISTATYEPGRVYESGFRYDATTGICDEEAPYDAARQGAIEIDGNWYRPRRRHLTSTALRAELGRAGVHVVAQEGAFGGDVLSVAKR